MRILVICDGIAGLSPRDASDVIGEAFAERGGEVAVIPVGVGGPTLAEALAAHDAGPSIVLPTCLRDLGAALTPGPGRLVLDLNALPTPTSGELADAFDAAHLASLRGDLAGREVVAVVPRGEPDVCLTGLNGSIAALGRERGADLAETITENNLAEAWALGLGVDPLAAGAGALGGVGAVVLAVGGVVTTGLELCLRTYGAKDVAAQADLIVTGAAHLDFHDLGGPVVKAMSGLAASSQRPLVAIAGRTYVSSRELRLAGIEAAYSVLPGSGQDEPSPEQLLETARKVATTWWW